MIQQVVQTGRNLGRIGMVGIQPHLDQLLLVEDQLAWQSQHILDQLCRAKRRQSARERHPPSNPSQQVMRQIGQQNQRFLRGPDFLASPTQQQPAFVSLDFGFTGATGIIMRDHLLGRPTLDRAQHHRLLQIATRIAPAQHQPLHGAHERDCRLDRCQPAIVGAQLLPGGLAHLPCQGCWSSSTATLGQDLPVVFQGSVHVGITPKAGVGAQDRASLLGLRQGQSALQRFKHWYIGRRTLLLAGVKTRFQKSPECVTVWTRKSPMDNKPPC